MWFSRAKEKWKKSELKSKIEVQKVPFLFRCPKKEKTRIPASYYKYIRELYTRRI